jgi:hypothetical protein
MSLDKDNHEWFTAMVHQTSGLTSFVPPAQEPTVLLLYPKHNANACELEN